MSNPQSGTGFADTDSDDDAPVLQIQPIPDFPVNPPLPQGAADPGPIPADLPVLNLGPPANPVPAIPLGLGNLPPGGLPLHDPVSVADFPM